MTDRDSRIPSNPSRRPCIKGPDCRGKCCISMEGQGAQRQQVTYSADDSDSSFDGSETDDPPKKDGPPNAQSSDVTDGSVLNSLGKSTSFSTITGETMLDTLYTNEIGSGDSKIHQKSMTELNILNAFPPMAGDNCTYETLSNETPVGGNRIPGRGIPIPGRDTPIKTNTIHTPAQIIGDSTVNRSMQNCGPVLVALIVCVLACCCVPVLNSSYNQTVRYAQSDFQEDLNKIRAEYKMKRDTMLQIQFGIETTFKRQDTSSIVFLYDDDFLNEANVKEFVDKVANATAKFLRNETGSASPIVVKNSDLDVNTVGELIGKYRNDLEYQGVLLVEDLEDIPVNLAMAFHYYCDEYDPLVKKTAIFFTLNLAKCRTKVGKTQHEVVEQCLAEKWRALEQEKLAPLLTRVVNVVVDLAPDVHP